MPALFRPTVLRRCPGPIAAAITVLLVSGSALAQQPEPTPPRENPGLVNEIGKLLKDPTALLPDFVKPDSKTDTPAEPSTAAPAAQPAQPPAAPQPAPASPQPPRPAAAPSPPSPPPAPSASPSIPAMVNGRQVCPASANGGADCAAGAAILCRSKGYQDGRSLAIDATEKCSAKVLIPGRTREPGDCRTENFVTRAWCQ
ncbi:MAG: hypothetical protein HZA66_19690 [Rhodopseudomonas palustris]|uniref:Uncharacterized protein n=1 Tax=Rhodopseudomonas palustris TaxID=1076 RepID=A0A933S0Q4_RHOPL|nr:hypothetical protein [Rhodopseudomonas palustris]